MKTHAIIPVFVPHAGCPNDCVFCNQKAITARSAPPTIEDTVALIERNLATIRANKNITTVEIAFFGGSFTGIPIEEQTAYLEVARDYKRRGIIDMIHMSTRPDYIDEKILDNLKEYEVDIIELGVQSFDPEVLRRSNRGHTAEVVYKSAELIKSYGFTLGIQLMVGLPGDSFDKCMYSVAETIKIGPSIARIYPTVVLADTELLRMAELGTYTPLSESEAVATAKEMYKALTGAGINVIRVGLKSTDVINAGSAAIGAGGYHPAFRQLVEGEIAKESLEAQLTDLLAAHAAGAGDSDFLTAGVDASSLLIHGAGDSDFPAAGADASASLTTDGPLKVTFSCHPSSFSNMIGNCKANKIYFTEKYPALSIRFAADKDIEPGSYKCSF